MPRRPVAGAAGFTAAVLSRQFLLAYPAGLALADLCRKKRAIGDLVCWAIPVISLAALFALWGGTMPPRVRSDPAYAATALRFTPAQLNVFAVLLGFYFAPLLLPGNLRWSALVPVVLGLPLFFFAPLVCPQTGEWFNAGTVGKVLAEGRPSLTWIWAAVQGLLGVAYAVHQIRLSCG